MKEIKPFADILQNKRSWKFRKFHRQAPVLESLFNKVAGSWPVTLLKRGSNKSVSCEICEIFKNTFFREPLRWLLLEYWICSSLLPVILIQFLFGQSITYQILKKIIYILNKGRKTACVTHFSKTLLNITGLKLFFNLPFLIYQEVFLL